jgi:hypothetical protein
MQRRSMLAMPSAGSFGAAGWWRVSRDASAVHKKEGKSYRQGKAKPFFQVSLSPSKSFYVFGGGGNRSLLTGLLILSGHVSVCVCDCVLHLRVDLQLE